jgi:hypothetical protein
MTKKQKRSVKRTPMFNPLNDIISPEITEEKKESEMEIPREENLEMKVDQEVADIVNEDPELSALVEEEPVEEDMVFESISEEPPIETVPTPKVIEAAPRYWSKVNASSPKKTTETFSQSILSSPMIKYGLPIIGGILFLFIIFKRSSKPSGPVIVDVTESGNGEKKSVRNSVNRVSSPRIVFGDLRKNPSLMVAPPITPGAV